MVVSVQLLFCRETGKKAMKKNWICEEKEIFTVKHEHTAHIHTPDTTPSQDILAHEMQRNEVYQSFSHHYVFHVNAAKNWRNVVFHCRFHLFLLNKFHEFIISRTSVYLYTSTHVLCKHTTYHSSYQKIYCNEMIKWCSTVRGTILLFLCIMKCEHWPYRFSHTCIVCVFCFSSK